MRLMAISTVSKPVSLHLFSPASTRPDALTACVPASPVPQFHRTEPMHEDSCHLFKPPIIVHLCDGDKSSA